MRESYSKIKEILDNNPVEDKIIYNPDLRIYEKLSVIEKRWKENINGKIKNYIKKSK